MCLSILSGSSNSILHCLQTVSVTVWFFFPNNFMKNCLWKLDKNVSCNLFELKDYCKLFFSYSISEILIIWWKFCRMNTFCLSVTFFACIFECIYSTFWTFSQLKAQLSFSSFNWFFSCKIIQSILFLYIFLNFF